MNRLTVTGVGNLQVKPDMMRLSTQLSTEASSYQLAYEQLQKQHDIIMDAFKDVMMNRALVKTSSLNVQLVKDYQTKEKSYQATQDLVYEDKINFTSLKDLLHELRLAADFNFNVSYFLKSYQLVDQDALILAVNDATDKAKVISAASGVVMGPIIDIEYIPETNHTVMRSAMVQQSDTPSEIGVSAKVSITWKIDK